MPPNPNVAELNKVTLVRGVMLQPEHANVRVTAQLFGLSRTEVFRLLKEGKIRSVHYKTNPAFEKGVQLIDLSSVREFLRNLASQESVAPPRRVRNTSGRYSERK